MNAGGWILLIASWSAIVGVTVVSLWKSLRVRPPNLSATLELELEDKGPGAGEEPPR